MVFLVNEFDDGLLGKQIGGDDLSFATEMKKMLNTALAPGYSNYNCGLLQMHGCELH